MANKSGAEQYSEELITMADNALKLAQLNYGDAQKHENFAVDFNAVDVAQVFVYEEAKNLAKDPNANLELSTRYIFGHDAGYEAKNPLKNDKDLVEVTLKQGDETVKFAMPASMLKEGDALFQAAKAEVAQDLTHDKTDSRQNYNNDREIMLNTTAEGAAIKEFQARPVEELQKSRETLTNAIYNNKEFSAQVVEDAVSPQTLEGLKNIPNSPLSYIKDEKIDNVKDVLAQVKSDNQSELATPKAVEKPVKVEKAFADEQKKRSTEKPVSTKDTIINKALERPQSKAEQVVAQKADTKSLSR
jgi:hypothetical protein